MSLNKQQLSVFVIIIFALTAICIDFVNAKPLQNDTVIEFLIKNNRFQKADQLLKNKLISGKKFSAAEWLQTYNQLIVTQMKIGTPDSAIFFCRKAVPLIKKTRDTLLIAETYKTLGMGYKNNSQADSAIYFTKIALDLNYRLNNVRDYFQSKYLRGNI